MKTLKTVLSIVLILVALFYLRRGVQLAVKVHDTIKEVEHYNLSDSTTVKANKEQEILRPYGSVYLVDNDVNLERFLRFEDISIDYFLPYQFDTDSFFYIISLGAPIVDAYTSLYYTLFKDDSPFVKIWQRGKRILFYDVLSNGQIYSSLDCIYDAMKPDHLGDGLYHIYRIPKYCKLSFEDYCT